MVNKLINTIPFGASLIWMLAIIVLGLQSEFLSGGADSYTHFNMAKWSFEHPHLFLDQWGKPLFTTFMAPWAQFGIDAVVIANVSLALAALFITAITAKKMDLSLPWIAVVFVLAGPVYSAIMISSLTEIIFAFTLSLSVFFVVNKQYTIGFICISFIPFARTEGIIFLPLFALVALLVKKPAHILFLGVGFMSISLVGLNFYDDLWWVIHQMPYGHSNVYGSGDLLHFYNYMQDIFGNFVFWLAVIGVVISLISKGKNRDKWVHIILIFGCGFGYFLAHAFVWWQGMGSSLGLTRVMAGVAPLFGIMACFAVQPLFKVSNTYLKLSTLTILIYFSLTSFMNRKSIPILSNPESALNAIAGSWVKEEIDFEEHYVVFYNPTMAYFLEIDPYNTERCREGLPSHQNLNEGLPENSILIYDTHFGNERGLPLDTLIQNQDFTLKKSFLKADYQEQLGEHDYEIYIFELSDS